MDASLLVGFDVAGIGMRQMTKHEIEAYHNMDFQEKEEGQTK